MKIITIGRGDGCTIQIDNEFISRQHAIIRVYPTGKMELIDKSSNGTSINGRPMKPNTPYRVRRKDVVTFAGQAQLVWSDVPDPLRPWKIAGICLLVILATLGGLYAFKDKFNTPPTPAPAPAPAPSPTPAPTPVPAPTDGGGSAQTPKPEGDKNSQAEDKEKKTKEAIEDLKKAMKKDKPGNNKQDSKKKDAKKNPTTPTDTSNIQLW